MRRGRRFEHKRVFCHPSLTLRGTWSKRSSLLLLLNWPPEPEPQAPERIREVWLEEGGAMEAGKTADSL